MRTDLERIAEVHRRAEVLIRKRDLFRLRFWGGTVLMLLFSLVAVTAACFHGHGMAADMPTGASLLSDAAGGYVLVGVLAFMAGVTVAVILIRGRGKRNNTEREQA